jgi:hypothetical protein
MARGGEGVRVEGLNALTRDLQKLGAEVDDLKDVFSSIAREGAELASSFAPKVSGRLAGTLRGNRAKSKAVVTAGRAAVPYAGAINYGWPVRNITGAMFMQKADAELSPRAVDMLDAGIDKIIHRLGLDREY